MGAVLMGLGPGNSRQRNFLPQAYNDFIYSIIIEEYGLAGRGIHDLYIPHLSFQVYQDFQAMSLRVRRFSCIGVEFHISNTGRCQYGRKCKPGTGNRRYAAAGKHGRKFIPVYLLRDRDHFECGEKC
jgi:hypothetical protein